MSDDHIADQNIFRSEPLRGPNNLFSETRSLSATLINPCRIVLRKSSPCTLTGWRSRPPNTRLTYDALNKAANSVRGVWCWKKS